MSPAAADAANGQLSSGSPPDKLRFAMVCASNFNRSMEAHAVLKKHGFVVGSYGVGGHVKLPGPSARQPNVYNFGTPYTFIYEDLIKKDKELYTRNGLLKMLERNMVVKTAPQRWQDSREPYDVVVTFEERVMDAVVEDMANREVTGLQPCLIVNLDVKDNADEAAVAALQALRLCGMLEAAAAGADGCWEVGLDALLDAFQAETGRRPIYSVAWF